MATPAEQISVRLEENQKQWLDEYHKNYPSMPRSGLFIQLLFEWMQGKKQNDELKVENVVLRSENMILRSADMALRAELAELREELKRSR